jgi:hypothetical protein
MASPGPGDLLIEGEEEEYFLELLMREASPGKPNPASRKTDQLAGDKEDPRSKPPPPRAKGRRRVRRRPLREIE